MARRIRRRSYGKLFNRRKQHNCTYCGLRFQPTGPRQRTADHVRALSQGGYDKRKNVVPCCHSCNQRKGHMTKEQFQNLLREIEQRQER